MTLLISDENAILFLHVPKCGGTSVVEMFTSNGYCPQLQMRGMPPHPSLLASPQHQTCERLRSFINFSNVSDVFILTRSPYQRLRSEYNWFFRGISLKDRPRFNEWVIESLAKAERNPLYADSHFRPALDFLDIDIPAKVFRLEDGMELIADYYLNNSKGTKSLVIEHKNNSRSMRECAHNLEFDKRALAAVNAFYCYDFLAFGYEIDCTGDSLSRCSKLEVTLDKSLLQKAKNASRWRMDTLIRLQEKLTAILKYKVIFLTKESCNMSNVLEYCKKESQRLMRNE